MADKELYSNTSLTEGTINPGDDRARLDVIVTGLDGSRSNLATAINEAVAGRLVHPDNSSLPLRTATAQWGRGADDGSNAAAIVTLLYDKNGRSVAESSDFSVVADVSVRYVTIEWWADDFPDPATEGTSVAITLRPDPNSGNANAKQPTPTMVEVPIWRIAVPVSLSSSPVDSVDQVAGKINSGALSLSDKSFAANTLRFDGLDQRVTRIDSGSGLTYEFDVRYVFSYREDGWYESILVATGDTDEPAYEADKKLIYEAVSFPTFPA